MSCLCLLLNNTKVKKKFNQDFLKLKKNLEETDSVSHDSFSL